MRLTGAALVVLAGFDVLSAHAADVRSPAGPGSVFAEEEILEGFLDPLGYPSARAGSAVAVSGDIAIVGAPNEEPPGHLRTGAAYVFVKSHGAWTQAGRFDGSAQYNSLFGAAVAIDGDTIVVGAPDEGYSTSPEEGAVYVYVRSGTAWTLQQRIFAPDATPYDHLGRSVSLRGDTLAVGGLNLGPPSSDAAQGMVYVFQRSGTVWSFQQKLTASDAQPGDHFGASVSLEQDLLAIGAPDDLSPVGGEESAVYVFARSGSTWTEEQKLTDPAGIPESMLGQRVSLSGDTLVAGAPRDGFYRGSAVVFVRSGTTWSLQQKLTPAGNVTIEFGSGVAVSGDRLFVGAVAEDTAAGVDAGTVHAYSRSGSVWSEDPLILPSDGRADDLFGAAVAVAGSTLVVGAPFVDTGPGIGNAGATYVFVESAGGWTQEAKLVSLDLQTVFTDEFGYDVAISGDSIAVGAPYDNTAGGEAKGSVYVFARTGNGWQFQQKLTAPAGGSNNDRAFGYAIALDGDILFVAMLAQPSLVFVFERTGGVWSHTQTLTSSDPQAADGFGQEMFLSAELAVIGAAQHQGPAGYDQGAAYVFERVAGTWQEQQKLVGSNPGESDMFGFSVSRSGDTIAVGAPYAVTPAGDKAGAVYLFTRTGGTWTEQQRIVASDGHENAQFGWSASVSGDALAVGARFDGGASEPFRGAVYVFARSGSTWTQSQKVTASNGAPNDLFGWSVSLSSDLLLAISPGIDAAYVFGRTGATWTEREMLVGSLAGPGDGFVGPAASGGALAFGAPLADTTSPDAGRAYVFRMVPTDLSVTMTDGQPSAVPGTSVTYTVVATNQGPGGTASAHVTGVLPQSLSGATWTCTASTGSGCGANGTGAPDDRASLLPNGTATYTLTAAIDPAAQGTLTSSANVAVPPGGTDPDPSNSTATDVDALLRRADLRPALSDFPDPIGAGGIVSYGLEVSNFGPSDSSGATLVDTLPPQASFVASTPGAPTCVHAAGVVTCDLSGLPAGSSQAVEVQARVVSAAAGSTISNTVTATGTDPDPVAGNNTDMESTVVGPSSRAALVHGSSDWAALAAGPEHHYRIAQQAYSSYEVVVDGASGDLGQGQGPRLERVAPDGSVLQSSVPIGTGAGRSLRWENAGSAPVIADFIRVRSAGCETDCGADDVYHIRSWDTTLRAPRFNNAGSQTTILLLQNVTDADVDGHARFWAADGSLAGTHAFSLGPRALLVLQTATVPGASGLSGSFTVGHDAAYGALVGKLVALEPGTGFSFDTPLAPPPR